MAFHIETSQPCKQSRATCQTALSALSNSRVELHCSGVGGVGRGEPEKLERSCPRQAVLLEMLSYRRRRHLRSRSALSCRVASTPHHSSRSHAVLCSMAGACGSTRFGGARIGWILPFPMEARFGGGGSAGPSLPSPPRVACMPARVPS